VAIHIFLTPIGKVFGFSMKPHGIAPSFLEFIQETPQTQLHTLGVGALTIGMMLAGNRWLPRWTVGICGKVRHESCALIPLKESTGQLIRSSAQNLQQEPGSHRAEFRIPGIEGIRGSTRRGREHGR
jgi:MFS superfamily sulfate permease-like transporter